MKLKPKIVQTLYSGLGGHANVVFSLLETKFNHEYINTLVFFGVDKVIPGHIDNSKQLSIKTYSLIKKPKQYIKAFKSFKKILNKEQPKFIMIHNSELLIPALRFKKKHDSKVIYIEHEPTHTKTIFENYLTKKALKKSDAVICLNNIYKNELLKFKTIKSKVIVIPNGINITKFKKKGERKNITHIGMAARMTNTKDHKNLILAFSKLKIDNLILTLAGIGNLEQDLKEYAKSLGISNSIKFLGLLNEEEMITFYQSIDLYVHATYSETLSTSILQAMATELIVITSDIDNNKALIKNGIDGFLYKNGQPIDLVNVIQNVITNHKDFGFIKKNARAKIENNYSNKTMAAQYQKMLEDI